MTQRFLRIAFAALALFLTLAGSLNLKRANAGLCDGVCGCPGGTQQCCTWEGVTCYNKAEGPGPIQPVNNY